MIKTRKLLRAVWAYCGSESQWIKIDENITIRYFNPHEYDYFWIHVYVNDVEVLYASNRGLFGMTVDKLYHIPKEAVKSINAWTADILKAKEYLKTKYKTRKKQVKRASRQKIKEAYKNKR